MALLRNVAVRALGVPRGVASLLAAMASRPGVRFVTLILVGVGLAATVATAIWYIQTRSPLNESPMARHLPGLGTSGQQTAPPFIFAIYGLERPVGVAVSPTGERIYAAESDGSRSVHAFDRAGKELASFAPPGTTPVQRQPTHVAVSPDGKVYVSDLRRAEVDVYSPDGGYQGTVRPAGLEGGWRPLALAFDQAGSLYATDRMRGKHRVLATDPQGRVVAQFGRQGNGPGELSFPNGLAVDATGLVYVSDSNNSRIQVLDLRRGFIGSFRSPKGTSLPRGTAIQGNRLYVADTIGDSVSVFALETVPRFLYSFGEEGRAGGQFLYPEELAADRTGRIYVADRENNRIQVFGQS